MQKINLTIKQKRFSSLVSQYLPRIIFELSDAKFSIYAIYVSNDFSVAKIYIDSLNFEINELLSFLNLNSSKFSHGLIKELKLKKKIDLRFFASENFNPIFT